MGRPWQIHESHDRHDGGIAWGPHCGVGCVDLDSPCRGGPCAIESPGCRGGVCPDCANTGKAEMYPGSRNDGNYYRYCDNCGRIDQDGKSLDGVMLR